jgi:hypothetical protein
MSAEELRQQVQQLLRDCDDTLQKAFDRLDRDDFAHSQDNDGNRSRALEQYRKTFTLEKAFIDQIRHGLESWNSNAPSGNDNSNGNKNAKSKNEDSSSLLSFAIDSTAGSSGYHTASSSSAGYPNHYHSSLDESLSIVFEDNGSSTQASSVDHQQQ